MINKEIYRLRYNLTSSPQIYILNF